MGEELLGDQSGEDSLLGRIVDGMNKRAHKHKQPEKASVSSKSDSIKVQTPDPGVGAATNEEGDSSGDIEVRPEDPNVLFNRFEGHMQSAPPLDVF